MSRHPVDKINNAEVNKEMLRQVAQQNLLEWLDTTL